MFSMTVLARSFRVHWYFQDNIKCGQMSFMPDLLQSAEKKSAPAIAGQGSGKSIGANLSDVLLPVEAGFRLCFWQWSFINHALGCIYYHSFAGLDRFADYFADKSFCRLVIGCV